MHEFNPTRVAVGTRWCSLSRIVLAACAWTILSQVAPASDDPEPTGTVRLDREMHHLRSGAAREWDSFPVDAEANQWRYAVPKLDTSHAWTLVVRQQDVRQRWSVRWDGGEIGTLNQDENDLWSVFEIPNDRLDGEEHEIAIAPAGEHRDSDDIRVGEARLIPRSVADYLASGEIAITVSDSEGEPIPSRLTIVDSTGALVPLHSAEPRNLTALRAGTVYTGTGRVTLRLPVGEYQIHAGRGFEYSLASTRIDVQAPSGSSSARASDQTVHLRITRQVDTTGWVACDPHVHTLTDSGHGDATINERMVTLAGEGIELPIATDHNVQVDQRPYAMELDLDRYFTPVVGNEVTTPVGHFNIFPSDPRRASPQPPARALGIDP
ncbi:MAG: hypothetical protein R3B96_08615 [Pirellulaceae bacterium]